MSEKPEKPHILPNTSLASFIPLSITPSIDNTTPPASASSSSSDIATSRNAKPPPIPSRIPSIVANRVSSNQTRASRTASLIIPVVTSENGDSDNNADDSIIDMDTKISSPTLPERPPKTPERPSYYEFEPQVLDQYGLDRTELSQFSPTSLRSSRTRNSMIMDNEDTKETLIDQNDKFLIESRTYQVDYIIDLLTKSQLVVANNVYFEKLHSSNSYIEVLSELRSGSFETANIPVLYTLLLKSLKIKEDSFNNDIKLDTEILKQFDELIEGLSFLLKSSSEQKEQFKNDIIRIYSIFKITNQIQLNKENEKEKNIGNGDIRPNPLVAAFVYRCASKSILPQALIISLMINEFIMNEQNENSKEFQFLLLRSFESIDPLKFLSNAKDINPLKYSKALLNSQSFWFDFVHQLFQNDLASKNHILGLTNVFNNLVIRGVNSLIEVILNLRHELGIFGFIKEDHQDKPFEYENANLVKFHREFLIINESPDSHIKNSTLETLTDRNHELELLLKKRNDAYNELLNNYKQLNEEKIAVSSLITKFQDENDELQATKRSISAQVDLSLGQYEVIKQTLEKNKRVQELNDSMNKEIERLMKENEKLRNH